MVHVSYYHCENRLNTKQQSLVWFANRNHEHESKIKKFQDLKGRTSSWAITIF